MDLGLGLIPVILVFAAAWLVAALWYGHRSRCSDALLRRWAAENGYRILRREPRFLFRGPFLCTTTKNQVVYHVLVEDRHGSRRTGWVCCGSWWLGLFSDRVEARWEDGAVAAPSPQAAPAVREGG